MGLFEILIECLRGLNATLADGGFALLYQLLLVYLLVLL